MKIWVLLEGRQSRHPFQIATNLAVIGIHLYRTLQYKKSNFPIIKSTKAHQAFTDDHPVSMQILMRSHLESYNMLHFLAIV